MPLSLGFHVDIDTVHALVVDVRTGAIAASVSARSLPEAFESVKDRINNVIGIGIATAETSDLSNAIQSFRSMFPKRIPVAPVVNDIHAHVAGVGVAAPSTLVMIMREPMRLLLNSRVRALPEGIKVIENGFLPGYVGYEIEQPAQVLNELRPDERRIVQTALETVRICEILRGSGVPVRRFVATGTVALSNPVLMQTYTDVLDGKIKVSAGEHPAALGAAIFGAIAAGHPATGHVSISQAIHAMTPQRESLVFRPDVRARKLYDRQRPRH
jgi:ribulose kinase